MKLEWFRQHKKFVYWVLLPIVGCGMAFFGIGTAMESSGSTRGPSVTYRVGGTERHMNSSEVLALRFLLTQYGQNPYGYSGDHHPRSSDEAAFHKVLVGTAQSAGFTLGAEEIKERMVEEVKGQIQRKDGSQPQINDAVYQKLLDVMQITPAQFEQMVEEYGSIFKYLQYLRSQARVNDEELFIAYLADKEVVRLRYKELKSEDFVAKAAEPTEDKIKEFYENNKKNVAEMKEVMFTQPRMSADLLFLDTEKLFGGKFEPSDKELEKVYNQYKPTYKIETKAGEPEKFKPLSEVKADVEKHWREDEAKNYYERYKRVYYKIEPKAGEPAPKPGEEKFKPYEEVKDEVAKKWYDEWLANQKRDRPLARMSALKTELADAEKAHEKEQEAKKPEERKPFDMAAWAKSKDLTHWVSDELTEEQFKAGKAEVGAVNASWVADLFYLKKESGNKFMDESNKRQAKEFRGPQIVDKGAVMYRIKNYKEEEPLPLDQAKPKIIARMKMDESVELARKEANKLKEDWAAGTNVPPVDTLEEVRGDKESKHALVGEYLAQPKPVGEPLTAEAPVDESPKSTNHHRKFYVGFAVERELPTRKSFHDDTNWPRDRKRDEIENSHFRLIADSVFRQMKEQGKVVGDVNGDPPLFERNSDN
ncbi:MAG TPA: hypothetical protein VEK08_05370 [Planctomycetota bacterium]|nr:hypothetical protein [Planctomycetota bacterium]